MRRFVLLTLSLLCWCAGARAAQDLTVIAHRGASGYLPEHTLEAYAFAYAQGADYIEPDLVLTRDGVLIARHEPILEETTDVAERFPDRRADDGHYYAARFTWAEISTLRVRPRLEGRFPEPSPFAVPRLEEIIALVQGLNAVTGCSVGLYPELKWPHWHRAYGLRPAPTLHAVLQDRPFDGPLRIQSFEPAPLRLLANQFGYPAERLVQLIDDDEEGPLDAARLREIAAYAGTIGPSLELLRGRAAAGVDLAGLAHRERLLVHAWTLRADDPAGRADFGGAVEEALALGIDGLFTDHPDLVLSALGRHKETTACQPIADRAP